jgi:hypothetical protein
VTIGANNQIKPHAHVLPFFFTQFLNEAMSTKDFAALFAKPNGV